jgi:4-amino-4-deoxy-L-arabinose transferase-like glycosyltransferase
VIRLAWIVVGSICLLRGVAAFTIPLTGDEAYYWEWSRRPAFGYVDHPPMVAWTIAAFSWLGHAAGFVRLGFVLCGVAATVALAAATIEITGDRRAGAVAALALALTPLMTFPFGTASPDGPYLMFWALGLWFAVRAFKRDRTIDWILLGVAVGGVLLSRVLGLAFLFGLLAYATIGERRTTWRRGIPIALGSALAACLPFLIWNATHDWVTLRFALFYRHDAAREFSFFKVLLTQIGAYSPGIWAAALVCAVRPRNALLAWIALPQFALVMLLSLFERVEIHWIMGFFVSLCAMLGVAYSQIGRNARIVWTAAAAVPAAILLVPAFAFLLAPAATWHVVQQLHITQPRNNGPFEIMTYSMVAADAAQLARDRNAVVMTDGYGLSSVMDFDAGVAPVVIGYNWQGREARSWYPNSNHPARALFVDKEPLSSRPDFAVHLRRACANVADGGVHGYSYGATTPRNYYFTWCEGLRPDALAILRWERESAQKHG